MRFFVREVEAEREAERLLAMGPEDHLAAAALEQGRASNPGPNDTEESAAAHEQRAQTHLLWAMATTLLGEQADAAPAGG